MATKARQQYFADEDSLQKIRREFSIADEIQQKIDSVEEWAQVNKIETIKVNWTALVPDAYKAVDIDVPEVIDNLYTVDSDNALSAKQWKILYDYIQNIASRWRFLSNWNSATGLPMTNPSESPYPYKSWDYFVVSNVAWLWGTNYRPDGSSYIIWQASTVVETESVDVSDFYFYDGTNWLLLKNSGRSWAVDSSLSTTSTNPVENRVITQALNWKQDILIAWTNIQIAADWKTISATDTTYTAGTGINIDANNVISNTQTSAEWWNITWTLSNQTDLQNALNNKANKTDVLEKTNTTSYTPSGDYNPATKKYVDDNAGKTYTAWANIQISAQDVISATDTTYTAGNWIDITNDEISVDTTVLATKTDLNSKQDTLVSWTNIKTINWTSILWSWDIVTPDTTYTAWTWIAIDSNNEISNTWVTSVNNRTWAVTIPESLVKVFSLPQTPWDDMSDIVDWLSASKVVIFEDWWHYYQVTEHNALTGTIHYNEIQDGLISTGSEWCYCYIIFYDTVTKELLTTDDTRYLLVPSWWSNWQVLTATSSIAVAWQTPSGWDVLVSDQPNNILTSWMKIRAWTETNYWNLGTYDSNTLYLTVE